VRLEALARMPATASRAVILLHPHPLYGGTMHNAVILTLARMVAEQGEAETASLRFNFRGVEGSEGTHDRGAGELLDVEAAVGHVRHVLPRARITLVGYSFGSWVGLRAAWKDPDIERIALIAPATRLLDYDGLASEWRPLHAEIAVGDRDQLVELADARRLAERIGAALHVIEGADHFFVAHRRRLAQTLIRFVVPEG
jgi:alpha/beta superfamily hydrolase